MAYMFINIFPDIDFKHSNGFLFIAKCLFNKIKLIKRTVSKTTFKVFRIHQIFAFGSAWHLTKLSVWHAAHFKAKSAVNTEEFKGSVSRKLRPMLLYII